jgi:hypothetical protein
MVISTHCSNSSLVAVRHFLLVGVGAAGLAAASCTGDPARPPDLNGTWGHQRVFAIDSVCAERLPDGSIRNVECSSQPAEAAPAFPKYRPEFLGKVADLRDRQVQTDPVLRCHPPGVPRIGPPAKIVQTAAEVIFLYDDQNGSFFRIVPVDGRPHRTGLSSSYLGDAVGHFEGDTLIVETINFTDETWLTDNGAFHTRELKVIERLRRVSDTIEYQAAAHDPAVLVEPWTPPTRMLQRSKNELEEPPRCEERDLLHMVDPSQYHENPR